MSRAAPSPRAPLAAAQSRRLRAPDFSTLRHGVYACSPRELIAAKLPGRQGVIGTTLRRTKYADEARDIGTGCEGLSICLVEPPRSLFRAPTQCRLVER